MLDAERAAGIPAILDAEVGAPGVLEDLAQRATHVLYSETGLDAHVGTGDAGGQLVRAQAALPHAFVGVTRGAEGFYWLQDGKVGHAAGVKVNAIDTLGAGDVFHGAYALALPRARARPMRHAFPALRQASREVFGGRIGAPTRADVLARMSS